MAMATLAEYEREWDELDEAIERNGLLIERLQAIEDDEQAAYLAEWQASHADEEYGWDVYAMATLAMVILWGAALWPWAAALWRFVWEF